jgi:hypothetical protein
MWRRTKSSTNLINSISSINSTESTNGVSKQSSDDNIASYKYGCIFTPPIVPAKPRSSLRKLLDMIIGRKENPKIIRPNISIVFLTSPPIIKEDCTSYNDYASSIQSTNDILSFDRIPGADILIYCGPIPEHKKFLLFMHGLKSLPHKHKFIIARNHNDTRSRYLFKFPVGVQPWIKFLSNDMVNVDGINLLGGFSNDIMDFISDDIRPDIIICPDNIEFSRELVIKKMKPRIYAIPDKREGNKIRDNYTSDITFINGTIVIL